MNNSWFHDDVFLAFRFDKALRAVSEHSPFVDDSSGLPEWKAQVTAEPPPPTPVFLRQELDLAEVISRLDLSPPRMTFLRKQVLAIQTICQKLCGDWMTVRRNAALLLHEGVQNKRFSSISNSICACRQTRQSRCWPTYKGRSARHTFLPLQREPSSCDPGFRERTCMPFLLVS